MAAGTINTIVGSGTLITFPVLLAFGYSPVVANVSNTVGLVPGSLVGAYGYRAELTGKGQRTTRLSIGSALGALTGSLLLLALPGSAFKAIVPVFIACALVLVVLQPRLSRLLEERRAEQSVHEHRWTVIALFGIGVYGGYFGAAQGILLLPVLALSLAESLREVNGVKNILAGLTNLVAGIVFVIAAHVDWKAAALLALGSTCGGFIGSKIGRRISPSVLRGLIVVIGAAAIVKLLA